MKISHQPLFILLLLSSLANAGGIPVIDSSNLAQQVQQVVSWGKQLQAMKDQYDQQVKQYQSMTGQRGTGLVLNDPKLRQYLPQEWKKVYDGLYRPELMPGTNIVCNGKTSNALALCEAEVKKNYSDRANYEQAYQVATGVDTQIQKLILEINNTNDPKAIAELQARISGEQAKIQNAMVQLQLGTQLADIQNKLIKQTKREAMIKSIEDEVGKPTPFPEPLRW